LHEDGNQQYNNNVFYNRNGTVRKRQREHYHRQTRKRRVE
jgi:hypothetical protein